MRLLWSWLFHVLHMRNISDWMLRMSVIVIFYLCTCSRRRHSCIIGVYYFQETQLEQKHAYWCGCGIYISIYFNDMGHLDLYVPFHDSIRTVNSMVIYSFTHTHKYIYTSFYPCYARVEARLGSTWVKPKLMHNLN